MKKLLVILLISSILLTQCYTQKEYLTKDYVFNSEDDLKKVVLTDGTEREFSFNQFNYKIESDSLAITYNSIAEKFGDHTRFHSFTDSLTLAEIHSIFISEYDGKLTTISIIIGGLVVLGIAFWANGGLFGDDGSLVGGMGYL
jgi:hypothetical protein